MKIDYLPYSDKFRQQLISLFEEFQDYLIHIDPLKRVRRLPGYGRMILDSHIKQIKEQNGIFLLAVDGEEVVGFSIGVIETLSEKELMWTKPSVMGRILEIYIEALHRGSGIGSSLMKMTEAYFRDNGCDVVKIQVDAQNEPAVKLYQKLGFIPRTIDNIKKLS